MNAILLKFCFYSLLISIPPLSHADQEYRLLTECFACNEQETLSKARETAQGQLIHPPSLTIHVADLFSKRISSFEIRKIAQEFQTTPESTPPNIKAYMDRLIDANNMLDQKIRQLIIPVNIISDAWEFVNCAYCKNNVNDYLKNALFDDAIPVQAAIKQLKEAFKLSQTELVEYWEIPLAAEGAVQLMISKSDIHTLMIKWEDVRDKYNSIPKNASQLHLLKVQVDDDKRIKRINTFVEQFDYQIQSKTPGIVLLKPCSSKGCDSGNE